MRKGFFPKLALINIKKNGQSYFPFMISCICTVMMYYIMHSISKNKGIFELYGAAYIIEALNLGTVVIAIFSVIFLFYTNSFLIKRRKKELGLYNILGLEKKHIGKMMFYETLFIAVVSIVIGLAGGILLYKLVFLLLLKILNFQVPLEFSIPASSIITTIVLFSIIFTLSLLFNLGQVHLANPIELLKGSNQGEKEPKVKWLMVLLGVVTLGAGYAIALLIESPLSALSLFFVAVILVMIGTYCLFTSGSIALLKVLKKNKKYYYKISHFTSVSGMMYRMKQNAVGLANICILCTGILIMISTTVSFYVGQQDILRTRFPKDVMITCNNASDKNITKIEELVGTWKENEEISVSDVLSYRQLLLITDRDSDKFETFVYEGNNYANMYSGYLLSIIPLEDFNKMEGTSLVLQDDEVYIHCTKTPYEHESVSINGQLFQVKDTYQSSNLEEDLTASMVKGSYDIIVKDVNILNQIASFDTNKSSKISYNMDFDVEGNRAAIVESTNALKNQIGDQVGDAYMESLESERESFLALYGGLLFLAIFLGILFMLATTLIIYYKQISEGYDDKERFEIMQKVGMSKQEVKKAIKSQIVLVFSLPLITAIIHIAFSFKIITKILAVLNLTNVTLFIICTVITIAVFSIAYRIVYALTARTYYKIVE